MARAAQSIEEFSRKTASGRLRTLIGRALIVAWALVLGLGAQMSGDDKEPADVSSGPVSKIEAYCGNNMRIGRSTDPKLDVDGGINNYLGCRAVDAQGKGVNGAPVKWLHGGKEVKSEATHTFNAGGFGSVTGSTWVLAPSAINTAQWTTGLHKFTAQIEGDRAPPSASDDHATVTVIKLGADNERSGLTDSSQHETYWENYGNEIIGNGLVDRFRGHAHKAIIVELDYDGHVTDSEIETAKAVVEDAMEDIGIAVYWEGGARTPLYENPTSVQIRDFLAYTRDVDTAIHVLVVNDSWLDGAVLGATFDFFAAPHRNDIEGYEPSVIESWHYATGPTEWSQEKKDSTGCVVFFDRIDELYRSDLNAANWWISKGHCVGLVITHELGHALGISDHQEGIDDHDVMVGGFPFGNGNIFNRFETLNRFDHWDISEVPWPTVDGFPDDGSRNAVNTADQLGVHTVTLGW